MCSQSSILIIEDDGLIAMYIAETLEKAGYSVLKPEYSGEKAINHIETSPLPDLILMDIGLGGKLNGIETAKHILKQCAIPIIFLSAYSNQNQINEALSISPYGYILKPFIEDDLLAAISHALCQ